mmetsp:Transcript_3121/g.4162  ORF Transcript_3121/g.4162 Transcript_3121/m.4162 type:complete len:93 (+) Transcript_3121:259-537(+)
MYGQRERRYLVNFGKYGWSLVQKTHKIADILERNTKDGAPLKEFVGMTMSSAEQPLMNRSLLFTIIAVVCIIGAIIAASTKKLQTRKQTITI